MALVCVLAAVSLMNMAVFPLFDPVFTYARDISQTVQAIVFVGIGMLATFKPQTIKRIRVETWVVAMLLVGMVLAPLGLAFSNGVLLTIGAACFAAGRGGVVLAVSMSLARTLLSSWMIAASVSLAFVVGTALQALCWVVPLYVELALYFLLPLVSFVLTRADVHAVIDLAETAEAPVDAAVTRPKSYLPLASQVFVCLFLFHLAFGFSLRFGETIGVPVEVYVAVVPVGIAALLLMFWKRFDMDRLAQVSVLFVAVGLLFVSSGDSMLRNLTNICLSSGNSLFSMMSWIVIPAVCARNLPGSLSVAGWGNGVGTIGTVVGAALGVGANHLVEHSETGLMLMAGVLMVAFVGYALIGLKNFSFTETVEGVVPVENEDVRAKSPEDLFQARCDAIAEEYHLTPREREVFAMLARGRNREYIQEKLVVSRNTVKAHVRHVYEKLDIHSHQELIDLVEEGNLGAEFSGSSV